MSDFPTSGAAPGPIPHPAPPAAAPPSASMGRTLVSQAPYIGMLLASLFGVAYAGISAQPSPLYWMVVTPLFGLLCVAAGWSGAPARGGRFRLAWTQALHWAGFLLAMLVLFRPEVQLSLQARGEEIGLLMLLALGAFVAGVHAGSWRIVAVGAVLGASVPLLAVIQRSVLLVLTVAVLAAVVGAAFVLLARREKA